MMKCDGAGRPDELAAVCQERDAVKQQHDGVVNAFRLLTEKFEAVGAQRDALAKRVAQLETEKAVLIDFAKKSSEACEICRHVGIMAREKCEGICGECALVSCCVCAKCYGASEFEFIGVKDEGGGNG
jgi:hypothetical protein